MKRALAYLGLLVLACCAFQEPLFIYNSNPVVLTNYPCLVTFEGGTNGSNITGTLMGTGSTTGSCAGSWAGTGNSHFTFDTASQANLAATFNINGSNTTGTGSLGATWATASLGASTLVGITPSGASSTSWSASGWICWDWDVNGETGNDYSLGQIATSGGTEAVNGQLASGFFNWEVNGSVAGQMPLAGNSCGAPNGPYWLTEQFNNNGTHKMRMYDKNGLILGPELSHAASGAHAPASVTWGISGAETENTGHKIRYDNWILDQINGVYPVLPTSPGVLPQVISTNQTTSNSLTLAVTAGNTVFAGAFDGNAASETVVFSDGVNSWTTVKATNLATDGDTIAIGCAVATTSTTLTVTVTGAGVGAHIIGVQLYQVKHAGCTLDTTTSPSGGTQTADVTCTSPNSNCGTGNITTTTNNDFILVYAGDSGGSGTTQSVVPGAATIFGYMLNNGNASHIEEGVQTAAGTLSGTMGVFASANKEYAFILGAFKAN